MITMFTTLMAPIIDADGDDPSTIVSEGLDVLVKTGDSVVLNKLSLPTDWEESVDAFLELQFSRTGLKSLAHAHHGNIEVRWQPCKLLEAINSGNSLWT